jgi:hypothetical protein
MFTRAWNPVPLIKASESIKVDTDGSRTLDFPRSMGHGGHGVWGGAKPTGERKMRERGRESQEVTSPLTSTRPNTPGHIGVCGQVALRQVDTHGSRTLDFFESTHIQTVD